MLKKIYIILIVIFILIVGIVTYFIYKRYEKFSMSIPTWTQDQLNNCATSLIGNNDGLLYFISQYYLKNHPEFTFSENQLTTITKYFSNYFTYTDFNTLNTLIKSKNIQQFTGLQIEMAVMLAKIVSANNQLGIISWLSIDDIFFRNECSYLENYSYTKNIQCTIKILSSKYSYLECSFFIECLSQKYLPNSVPIVINFLNVLNSINDTTCPNILYFVNLFDSSYTLIKTFDIRTNPCLKNFLSSDIWTTDTVPVNYAELKLTASYILPSLLSKFGPDEINEINIEKGIENGLENLGGPEGGELLSKGFQSFMKIAGWMPDDPEPELAISDTGYPNANFKYNNYYLFDTQNLWKYFIIFPVGPIKLGFSKPDENGNFGPPEQNFTNLKIHGPCGPDSNDFIDTTEYGGDSGHCLYNTFPIQIYDNLGNVAAIVLTNTIENSSVVHPGFTLDGNIGSFNLYAYNTETKVIQSFYNVSRITEENNMAISSIHATLNVHKITIQPENIDSANIFIKNSIDLGNVPNTNQIRKTSSFLFIGPENGCKCVTNCNTNIQTEYAYTDKCCCNWLGADCAADMSIPIIGNPSHNTHWSCPDIDPTDKNLNVYKYDHFESRDCGCTASQGMIGVCSRPGSSNI